jgi:hypothetical protein
MNLAIPNYGWEVVNHSMLLQLRARMNCSALNAHLFIRNLVESPFICGIAETVSHFLLSANCFRNVQK